MRLTALPFFILSFFTTAHASTPWPEVQLDPIEDVVLEARIAKSPESFVESQLATAQTPRTQGLLHMLRGLKRFRSGDYRGAFADFDAADDIAITDVRDFYAAESLFHLGAYAQAEKRYKAITNSVWKHRAKFRLADCAIALGRKTAPAQIAQALKTYPDYPSQPSAYWALGEFEQTLNHRAKAAEAYRKIELAWPSDPLAKSAKAANAQLEAQGQPPAKFSFNEQYAHADDLRRRKYYNEAAAIFRSIKENSKAPAKLRKQSQIQLGRVQYLDEQFSAALDTLLPMTADATPAFQKSAWKWLSEVYSRQGEVDKGAEALAKSLGTVSKLEKNQKLAVYYFDQGAYAKADEIAKEIKRKGLPYRLQAWLDYRMNRLMEADKAFTRHSKGVGARDRATYWLARIKAKRGLTDEAQKLFRDVIQRWPTSFYAYLAEWRLGLAEDRHEPLGQGYTNIDAPRALDNMARRYGQAFPQFAQAAELSALGEDLLTFKTLRESAVLLTALRQRATAYSPNTYVDNRKPENRSFEWGSALPKKNTAIPAKIRRAFLGPKAEALQNELKPIYRSLGDFYAYRRLLQGNERLSGAPEQKPTADWQSFYPKAFEAQLTREAKRVGLDPYLLWAFMTAESAYNPWAISHAGARGLMQFMQQTGGLIADKVGLRDFGSSQLFEPEIILPMAAWYVSELVKKFHGQLPLAIASYNAGPHRVAVWLSLKGDLPLDEFIEEIPYDEAREYTKKVLKYLAMYRRIHEGAHGLRFKEHLDRKFESNINF